MALELEIGIIINKNAVPNDPMSPFYPSGIRLGPAEITTRGMKEKEMVKIAKWMNEAINVISNHPFPSSKEGRKEFWKNFKREIVKNKKLISISREVKNLCSEFPLYN